MENKRKNIINLEVHFRKSNSQLIEVPQKENREDKVKRKFPRTDAYSLPDWKTSLSI